MAQTMAMRGVPPGLRAVAAASMLGLLALATPIRGAFGAAPDLGTEAQRDAGRKLYLKYCSQCHGEKGDGEGYAAPHLLPKPRNFTSGKFKVRTTPNGALPTHQDLVNIIRRGMPYTSMPAWPNFSDQEVSDLAYYITTFSPEFANTENIAEPVPLPSPPAVTKESIAEGKKLFEESGCVRCHGNLGRGDGLSAPTLVDDWGHPLKPADLTESWTFRGGSSREDIFRTMSTGFNGTPMPSFLEALKPEQRWAITDFIDDLSGGGKGPRYATLVIARHVDDPIDLAKGAAQFDKAPPARFPIVGQIMEPVRSFHPPTTSVVVQAIYDADSIALLVRWDDMSAQKTGKNGPTLPVPVEEEEAGGGAAGGGAEGGGSVWGEEEAAPPAGGASGTQGAGGGGSVWGDAEETAPPAAKEAAGETSGGGSVWGEEEAGAESTAGGEAAGPTSEFSDAIAVQLPSQQPTGIRKPYFIFGDAQSSVDLWFFDLARQEPQQFTGRGSADVAPNDTGDLSAVASYDQGQWSVIFKRPIRATSGVAFVQGQFTPIAFSVWDGFSRERGSKRGLTVWYYIYVEPEVVPSPAGPMIRTALLVLAIELIVIGGVRWRYGRQRRGSPGGERLQQAHGNV